MTERRPSLPASAAIRSGPLRWGLAASFWLAATAFAVGADAQPAAAQPAAAPPPVDVTPPPAKPAPDFKAPSLVWKWSVFQTEEYWVTGIAAAAAIGSLAIPTTSENSRGLSEGRWTARNSFDDGIRSRLRLSNEGGRKSADDASDLMLTLSLNYVLFDALVVAWWGHGRDSVAFQMTLIDLETLAVSTAITGVVKGIVGRERPYSDTCREDPAYGQLDDCDDDSRTRSFFSGHSSTAFTAAGLTCIHHANLPLYGGGPRDALACVGALGVATATGVLRITSDNHYASDVITGAAFGTLVGMGLPWLLHYRHGPLKPEKIEKRGVTWHVVPGPMSGAVVGAF